MDELFEDFEKKINKKHSINFTPKYKEEFRTYVSNNLFLAIAEKTIEKLEWDLVYKDENCIEAKRKEKSLGIERWTEGITISYDNGNVIVKSESLGNEIWDLGKNSKRVKLFIFAYDQILKTFDRESLKELEKEEEKKNNWDDYIIPEILPKPTYAKTPNISIPIIGGLVISIILGYIIAKISIEGLYIIFLVEFLVAIVIAFGMKQLIKLSNYTNFNKLQYLLIVMIVLIYSSNQYFQYEIIIIDNNNYRIGFWEFLKFRFSEGLKIKELNAGWIGLVISWIIQLGFTGIFVFQRVINVLTKYVIERVPNEVVDFVYFLLIKSNSEEEIRKELAKKGWSDIKNQDEVFQAIEGLQNSIELNKIN